VAPRAALCALESARGSDDGSSSIKIYKDPGIFIKIELIFIKITNPLFDLYKNHYTASWRPGGHLDIYKDQRQALAAGCLPRAQAVPVCFGYC